MDGKVLDLCTWSYFIPLIKSTFPRNSVGKCEKRALNSYLLPSHSFYYSEISFLKIHWIEIILSLSNFLGGFLVIVSRRYPLQCNTSKRKVRSYIKNTLKVRGRNVSDWADGSARMDPKQAQLSYQSGWRCQTELSPKSKKIVNPNSDLLSSITGWVGKLMCRAHVDKASTH